LEKNLFGNKVILVTGASGIVGAHLCISLLQQGAHVRAMLRKESSLEKAKKIFSLYNIPFEQERLSWVIADISLYEEVELVTQGVDLVFNCAGYVSFNNSELKELRSLNVLGVKNIVDACIVNSVSKLCHVSSVAALGKAPEGMDIDESCDFEVKKSRSMYGHSKYYGELEVWRGIAEGLNAIIVNPSVIIGPGQWDQSSGKLFSTVGKGLKFYTPGVTGYVGVQDVVACMIKLMDSDIVNERFVINAENLSYKEVFTAIANSIGVSPPTKLATKFMMHSAGILLSLLSMVTGKPSQITRQTAITAFNKSYFSSKKIQNKLGFTFRNVTDVIKETGSFYKR